MKRRQRDGKVARPGKRTRGTHSYHGRLTRARKLEGAFVCGTCRVVKHAGRWYWGQPPVGETRSGLCPACLRIRARAPDGRIHLDRAFLAHRDAVLGSIRNTAAVESSDHPLERLIELVEHRDGILVTTTGIHLARRIVDKLERMVHRRARIVYRDDHPHLDARWR